MTLSPKTSGLLFAVSFVLGIVLLAYDSTTTANNLAGLERISITVDGSEVLEQNSRVRLNVVGDYLTYTVPIIADWSIREGAARTILVGGCQNSKNCDVQSGHIPGTITVRASANGYFDDVILVVKQSPTVERVVHENPFPDAVPDWALTQVVELQKSEIMQGYDDGSFGAGDPLTRGQLVTLLDRVLKQKHLLRNPASCSPHYSDVPESHYAFTAVCTLVDLGWATTLRKFGPNELVSRGETASLLNRVVGPALLQASSTSLGGVMRNAPEFDDVERSHALFPDVAVVHFAGIMTGRNEEIFGIDRILNRAEAATIFWRLQRALDDRRVTAL